MVSLMSMFKVVWMWNLNYVLWEVLLTLEFGGCGRAINVYQLA